MIRDRIVIAAQAENIREKLLTHNQVISIARSYESSRKELESMASGIN